jgi:hypothetical protein
MHDVIVRVSAVLINNSMEQGPSRETNRSSVKKFPT